MAGYIGYFRIDGARFSDNDMRVIREGINVVGGRNITLERNRFEDFQPFTGDHSDAMQFFTTGLTRPEDMAARDIVIRNNLCLANGKAQCLFVTDQIGMAKQGRGYAGFTIEDNVVVGAAWHGITVHDAENIAIRNNRLLRVSGVDSMDSRIDLEGSTGTLSDNQANAFIRLDKVKQSRNRRDGPTDAPKVKSVIGDWIARYRKS
ncbi:MAG TPA: right-handed parallel beta-helix repeat-containing protein [Sphingomonas sp.]|nr:right-handed parallel beta-helix repeat-containing protein [Sphingomonas sp.]